MLPSQKFGVNGDVIDPVIHFDRWRLFGVIKLEDLIGQVFPVN
jgi:hypothetical protein